MKKLDKVDKLYYSAAAGIVSLGLAVAGWYAVTIYKALSVGMDTVLFPIKAIELINNPDRNEENPTTQPSTNSGLIEKIDE